MIKQIKFQFADISFAAGKGLCGNEVRDEKSSYGVFNNIGIFESAWLQ